MKKPTLALLHGLLNDRRVWEPVPALARASSSCLSEAPENLKVREAAALIRSARLHILKDVGHWAPLERPEEVAERLGRLLDRV